MKKVSAIILSLVLVVFAIALPALADRFDIIQFYDEDNPATISTSITIDVEKVRYH